jgi:hypothetical protein
MIFNAFCPSFFFFPHTLPAESKKAPVKPSEPAAAAAEKPTANKVISPYIYLLPLML